MIDALSIRQDVRDVVIAEEHRSHMGDTGLLPYYLSAQTV